MHGRRSPKVSAERCLAASVGTGLLQLKPVGQDAALDFFCRTKHGGLSQGGGPIRRVARIDVSWFSKTRAEVNIWESRPGALAPVRALP